jgi:hypothetical protein
MVTKISATGVTLTELPAVGMIGMGILEIFNPGLWGITLTPLTIVLLILLGVVGAIGTLISKMLQRWWGKLVSIVGAVIGFIYFGWIIAGAFLPGAIAAGAMGAGGVVELFDND